MLAPMWTVTKETDGSCHLSLSDPERSVHAMVRLAPFYSEENDWYVDGYVPEEWQDWAVEGLRRAFQQHQGMLKVQVGVLSVSVYPEECLLGALEVQEAVIQAFAEAVRKGGAPVPRQN